MGTHVADKVNCALILSPTPTQINNMQLDVDNDDVTVITSNTAKTAQNKYKITEAIPNRSVQ